MCFEMSLSYCTVLRQDKVQDVEEERDERANFIFISSHQSIRYSHHKLLDCEFVTRRRHPSLRMEHKVAVIQFDRNKCKVLKSDTQHGSITRTTHPPTHHRGREGQGTKNTSLSVKAKSVTMAANGVLRH